jgi:hypothetical protein
MKEKPPGKVGGAQIPYEYIYGNPEVGCPCIIADDKRLKDLKTSETLRKKAKEKRVKSVAKAERSLKVRLKAVEKALWGRDFEGLVGAKRPAVNCSEFVMAGMKKTKSVKK